MATVRFRMRFSTGFPLLIPRLDGVSVGKVDSAVAAVGVRVHCVLVSAMELALMGGWPTKDGRAGSGAFEFIRKGSGRKPRRLRPFFLPKSKSGTLTLLRERHVGASLEPRDR